MTIEFSTRLPPPNRELFVGYSPAFRDQTQWLRSYSQVRTRSDGTVLRRTNWDSRAERDSRLIVTVAETASLRQAIERLAVQRKEDGIDYRPGPDRLGPNSIVFPFEKPMAAHYVRANLRISLVNGGRTPIDVSPWADVIARELAFTETDQVDDALELTRESPAHGVQTVPISFRVPWVRSESAWFKFVTSAGTLTKGPKQDQLLLSDIGEGPATVTGWAMEHGRETFWGSLVIRR